MLLLQLASRKEMSHQSFIIFIITIMGLQTCQPSRFWRDSPAFLPDVPLNHGNVPLFVRSRIFFAHAICSAATVPRRNANHPIERNYGNSVRLLAKIPNGTAAESP